MPTAVKLKTRRTSPVKSRPQMTETVILRDDEVIAVLRQGDPLLYLLELSADQLESMKKSLAPVLERRPRVKEILEAIIEYKGEEAPDQPPAH